MTIHSFLFFGSLSIPLSQALLSHLFSYNIRWGATRKVVENPNFFILFPRIMNRHGTAFVLSFLAIFITIIFSSSFLPLEWQVPWNAWAALFPLLLVSGCHILFPIMSNTLLIEFSY